MFSFKANTLRLTHIQLNVYYKVMNEVVSEVKFDIGPIVSLEYRHHSIRRYVIYES